MMMMMITVIFYTTVIKYIRKEMSVREAIQSFSVRKVSHLDTLRGAGNGSEVEYSKFGRLENSV